MKNLTSGENNFSDVHKELGLYCTDLFNKPDNWVRIVPVVQGRSDGKMYHSTRQFPQQHNDVTLT